VIRQELRIRVRKSLGLAQLVVGWLRGRLPVPVQELSERALVAAAARWPIFAELMGMPASTAGSAASPVTHGTPSSAPRSQPETEPVQPAPSVPELLAQLERSPQWQKRAQAAAQLANLSAPAALAGLLRALRDPSADAAAAVVDALAARREPAATSALLEVVSNADAYFHPLTRVAAIHGLAEKLEGEALKPLLSAVQDVSAEVSIAAIAAVATRAPGEAGHLIHVLREHSGFFLPQVRLAAARVLTQTGALSASEAEQLLSHESDPSVRELLQATARRPLL
jgi:HEAT repeat protein